MTAPSDPEAAREPRDEEQEIVLRLRDILPRVPAHLLKPGPHDTESEIRFTVEELAEKISRGRVSVPLERLSRVCPEVFRDKSAFQGEQEVPLPLQKLLEQVGLVARKPMAANGMPGDQLAQARAQAGKIISGGPAPRPPEKAPMAPAAPTTSASPAETPTAPAAPSTGTAPEAPAKVAEPAAAAPAAEVSAPAEPPPVFAKAISTARHILGLFGLQGEPVAPAAAKESPPAAKERQSPPPPGPPFALSPKDEVVEPLPPTVQTATPVQSPPEPADQPLTEGCISLRVLPIFRLLSAPILRAGPLPAEDARMAVLLATVDPQLSEGHVEIPVEEFVKGLPEELKAMIDPIQGAKVWIPLDEIFQNLPPDHIFHMPALDLLDEPVAEPIRVPVPSEKEPEKSEAAPVDTGADKAVEVTQDVVDKTFDVPAPNLLDEPAEPEPEKSEAALDVVDKTEPEAEQPAAQEEPVAQEDTPMNESLTQVIAPAQEAVPEAVAQPEPAASVPAPEAPVPIQEASMEVIPPIPAESAQPAQPVQAPVEPTPPSRAPWMRGFQVPPPRLFGGVPLPEAPLQSAPVEPPSAPATPEAKRTVDFLASQTGIFAAAAFVEGAVFASTDFPRKPDLDALREFMGAFIDCAREHGRRLGWNRVLTIPCEQFHLTAVVRDSHFVVALHHDRVLVSPTYDALTRAADELSKAGG